MKKHIYLFIILFIAAACSSSDKTADIVDKIPPPEVIFNEAHDLMQARKYESAIEEFQKIESEYPYSKWSTRGKLLSAYASYKAGHYDDAINFLDSFIKLHPGNENIAYAYYLRAISYYDRIVDVGREQKITEEARVALGEVIARFPESDYRRDAKLKLDLVHDHLAGKEMTIGRFYQKKGQHVGAINRFKTVIDKYQTTTHAPEALHRLVESYLVLGIEKEAQKYAAVLGYNYPASQWYRLSYDLLTTKNVAEDLKKPEADNAWYKNIL